MKLVEEPFATSGLSFGPEAKAVGFHMDAIPYYYHSEDAKEATSGQPPQQAGRRQSIRPAVSRAPN